MKHSRITHLARHGISAATGAASLATGRSRQPGAVVLAYHDVVEDAADAPHYAVSVHRLRAQLDLIARLGLRVVPLRELSDAQRRGEDLSGRVAIVFDDALVGVHHLALPELAARAWSATLHPVVDRLGVTPAWWPGSQRTMTWPELQEAAAGGIELGAHGTTHACLPCLSDPTLINELRDPRARLEDLAGRAVDELAYPFGHVDERVRDQARAAGYTTAYVFLNGRVLAGQDPFGLPRLTMHEGLSPLRLLHQLGRRAQWWPPVPTDAVHPHASAINRAD